MSGAAAAAASTAAHDIDNDDGVAVKKATVFLSEANLTRLEEIDSQAHTSGLYGEANVVSKTTKHRRGGAAGSPPSKRLGNVVKLVCSEMFKPILAWVFVFLSCFRKGDASLATVQYGIGHIKQQQALIQELQQQRDLLLREVERLSNRTAAALPPGLPPGAQAGSLEAGGSLPHLDAEADNTAAAAARMMDMDRLMDAAHDLFTKLQAGQSGGLLACTVVIIAFEQRSTNEVACSDQHCIFQRGEHSGTLPHGDIHRCARH